MNRLLDVKPVEVSLVKRPAIGRVFLLTKSAEEPPQPVEKNMAEEKETVEKQQQQPAPSLVFKADGSPDFSSLPPEIRSVVEAAYTAGGKVSKSDEGKIEEIIKAERAEREKLEKALADERDLRINREFIQKASDDFGFLPLTPAELGPVVKEIAEKAPDAWKTLEPVLKGASELISKSALFDEVGRSRGGAAGDAWEEIEKAAVELVIKGAGKVSKDEAIDRILADRPELYARYEREREGQHGQR